MAICRHTSRANDFASGHGKPDAVESGDDDMQSFSARRLAEAFKVQPGQSVADFLGPGNDRDRMRRRVQDRDRTPTGLRHQACWVGNSTGAIQVRPIARWRVARLDTIDLKIGRAISGDLFDVSSGDMCAESMALKECFADVPSGAHKMGWGRTWISGSIQSPTAPKYSASCSLVTGSPSESCGHMALSGLLIVTPSTILSDVFF